MIDTGDHPPPPPPPPPPPLLSIGHIVLRDITHLYGKVVVGYQESIENFLLGREACTCFSFAISARNVAITIKICLEGFVQEGGT